LLKEKIVKENYEFKRSEMTAEDAKKMFAEMGEDYKIEIIDDLGVDKNGNAATLILNKIRDFFFDILNGKISVQDIDGKFDISQLNK